MTRPYRTCSSCLKFELEASLKTGGRGWCSSYERLHDYNTSACVLFDEARNTEQRKAWFIQLKQQESKV